MGEAEGGGLKVVTRSQKTSYARLRPFKFDSTQPGDYKSHWQSSRLEIRDC